MASVDVVLCVLFAIFTVFLTFCLMSWKSNYFTGYTLRSPKTVLFVTAHPDDECIDKSSGVVSKQLFWNLDELKLPDDPNRIWTDEIVGNVILKYIMQLSVDVVISFDENGVSGHCNHIAIYYGLKYLLEQGLIPKHCEVLALETVNIVRKYSSFLDLLFCVMHMQYTQELFLSNFKQIILLWTAMRAHNSQFVWFRKLYMLFSRYVYINTLKTINFEEPPPFQYIE